MEETERIRQLCQKVIQTPLSSLIAQCYGSLKANSKSYGGLVLEDFIQVFHRIVVGHDGLLFLVYDDETDQYYASNVISVYIDSIEEREQPDYGVMMIGGPIYDITFKVGMNYVVEGSAEDLYRLTEDTRELIESGWSQIDRRVAVPTNHITPHDLCSLCNLNEITGRLTWWINFLLDYKSPFNMIRTFGLTLCSRADILAMDLFFQWSLQLFASVIKHPLDMEPFKKYIVKGYFDSHQIKADKKDREFVKAQYKEHGLPIPDTSDLAIINSAMQPEVCYTIATTCYVGNS